MIVGTDYDIGDTVLVVEGDGVEPAKIKEVEIVLARETPSDG